MVNLKRPYIKDNKLDQDVTTRDFILSDLESHLEDRSRVRNEFINVTIYFTALYLYIVQNESKSGFSALNNCMIKLGSLCCHRRANISWQTNSNEDSSINHI